VYVWFEEMGFQISSKLSSTEWWMLNVEWRWCGRAFETADGTMTWKLGSRRWHKQVVSLRWGLTGLGYQSLESSRPWNTLEQCRGYTQSVAADATLNCILWGTCRQPADDITKDWSDLVELAGTNSKAGGGFSTIRMLQGDKRRYAEQNAVTVVKPRCNKSRGQHTSKHRLSVAVAHCIAGTKCRNPTAARCQAAVLQKSSTSKLFSV